MKASNIVRANPKRRSAALSAAGAVSLAVLGCWAAPEAAAVEPARDAAARAHLERRLGAIAIEELALDEAERHFLTSLALEPDNPLALRELAFIDEVRPYGSIDRRQRYFHAASGIRLPKKAGAFERLRIAYAEPTDVEADYEGLLAVAGARLPVSAALRVVSAAWQIETARAALLATLRSASPDLSVSLHWHREPGASPGPGVEVWHLVAASPGRRVLIHVWLLQREAWTVICDARYSPAAGPLGQHILAVEESLERLVRSIGFPAPRAPAA